MHPVRLISLAAALVGSSMLAFASPATAHTTAVPAGNHAALTAPHPRAQARPLALEMERDTAVGGTPDSNMLGGCSSVAGAEVCFQPYGDYIWVKDTVSDGLTAYGEWQNELSDGNNWLLYREGECANHLGAGHWGYCNKDFYEDSTYPNAEGGNGSRIWILPETNEAVGTAHVVYNDN